MRKLLYASLIALLPATAFGAESALQYAYTPIPPDLPPVDDTVKRQAPGTPTGMMLTMSQINDWYNPPDWFPDMHPPMPTIVAQGRAPVIRACAMCHLPNGGGHPESSGISGLSAGYIVGQLHEFRDGNRTNSRARIMIEIGKAITEEELKEAADYYASIPREQRKWIRVVEGTTAPKNFVGAGGKRFHDEAGGTIPIAPTMIYEVAEDTYGAENRDQRFGFVDYVPEGSLGKGEMLAKTGGNGKTIQCAICHGPEYRGIGNVPSLAGRSAYYFIRQLNDMRIGDRKGPVVALMQPVVENLTDEDIVNLAAYMASLEP